MGNANVDTTTGVFKLDASMFPVDKNENEIIVDNEDPGFKVVKPESFITSLFRKEKKREKYHEFFTGRYLVAYYSKPFLWLPREKCIL